MMHAVTVEHAAFLSVLGKAGEKQRARVALVLCAGDQRERRGGDEIGRRGADHFMQATGEDLGINPCVWRWLLTGWLAGCSFDATDAAT
jgi:hypothetical protein